MRDALLALATAGRSSRCAPSPGPTAPPGLVALMPSYLSGGPGAAGARYGLKAICITPSNPAAGLDTHQGVVLLSSGRDRRAVALLNASAVTEIRTAAVSVVATELLARPDADELAVIGTGAQARSHILALDGGAAACGDPGGGPRSGPDGAIRREPGGPDQGAGARMRERRGTP